MTEPRRSGILVLDKAGGVTSFSLVALVRRRLRARRVGHAGTLDPEAVGVLPILIGEATKLMPYLIDQDKEYVATVRFGVTTDTHDLTGRVVATAGVEGLDLEVVRTAARAFVGRVQQVPPMYSAVHHEGRRLYELARAGVEVARQPREVAVHSIAVEAFASPTATLRIVCGKGTYVRALAADLGAALRCGGAVERLVRTRVGPFRREMAIPSERLTAAAVGELWACVLPADAAVPDWGSLALGEPEAVAFQHGQAVAAAVPPASAPFLRVYDPSGTFLGVGVPTPDGRVKPTRILHADHPGSRVLPT